MQMSKTEREWREELTPEQYEVLREKGTERPFTGALLHEKRNGMFSCAAVERSCSRLGRSSNRARAGRASPSP